MTIKLVVQLLGGVGIFLYSIKLISDSLQLVAGDRLRHLVGMLTRTPRGRCVTRLAYEHLNMPVPKHLRAEDADEVDGQQRMY